MTDAADRMHFVAYHTLNLVIVFIAVIFTWKTVSRLRNSSVIYTARLPFAYYSISSWTLWGLQYLVLVLWVSRAFGDQSLLSTALWIGVLQNVLWSIAVLSLFPNQFPVPRRFSRFSLALLALIVFSVLIAFLSYRTNLLASLIFTELDAVLCAVIFAAFAFSILHLHLSKMFAAVFLIHGLSQWLWRILFFSQSGRIRLVVLLIFPLWRIVLLLSWIKLIPEFLQTAESKNPDHGHQPNLSVEGNEAGRSREDQVDLEAEQTLETAENLVELLTPLKVMISSTVADLGPEREAVDKALRTLELHRFRAETMGSVSGTPRDVCADMARQCDLFILILGERYGFTIEDGISVVEFEYNVAHEQNSQKILVYVKNVADREERLEEFHQRILNFQSGHFRFAFNTAEELSQRILPDVARWLRSPQAQKVEATRLK